METKKIADVTKGKVYLHPGQAPPKGASVHEGPNGGKFYEEGGASSQGQEKPQGNEDKSERAKEKMRAAMQGHPKKQLVSGISNVVREHMDAGHSQKEAVEAALHGIRPEYKAAYEDAVNNEISGKKQNVNVDSPEGKKLLAQSIEQTKKPELKRPLDEKPAEKPKKNAHLSDVKADSLDPIERRMYDKFTQGNKMSHEDALSVIVNSVEGDYSQLSEDLAQAATREEARQDEENNKGSKDLNENTPNLLLKSFQFDGINDEEMRKFECWGSVDVIDRANERIPADEVYKVMDIWMDRGAPIMFNHSNRQVGKGVNWRPAEKNGMKGVLITGVIFKHYKEDDEVWKGIKENKFEGLSIGGKAYSREKDDEGSTVLRNLIGYEFSVVNRTGNQEATFTEVNAMAKSEMKKEDAPVVEPAQAAVPASNAGEDAIAKLQAIVAALVEKIAMIEEKVSGKPEAETPVEEQKSCEEKPVEAEKAEDEPKVEEKPKEDEVAKLSKQLQAKDAEIADLKKSMVVKKIEAARPDVVEVTKADAKYSEVRKTLKEMSEKGSISFRTLGEKIRN